VLAARGSKCLVTGAAGFIGSHLTERLVALGHYVRAVDNFSTGDEANLAGLAGDIEVLRGDLCEVEVCRRAVAGIDVVFHVAALPSVPRSLKDPWASHAANVNATMRLLEACLEAKVARIIYSSSSSVYGDTAVLPKTESAEPLPRSPYAASKLAGEQYVLAFARAGMIEGVALRYFNVFGPRQSPHSPYAAVIPNFFQAALEERPAVVYGDGQQTRDFTYVDNVVDANILAAAAPAATASGWAANVGAGMRTSLLTLIEMIAGVTGRHLGYLLRPSRSGDVRDSLASLERAARLLGYRPRVGVEDGLRRTWRWMADGSGVAAGLAVGIGRRGLMRQRA
jgi:UDP-N-acetylglucosamine/UDP-N-acetyl-alpha-D-glucosaminouronate 4-epimerase